MPSQFQEASFAVPDLLRTGSLYGRAVISTPGIVDCWPCDDPAGSTSLRNLIAGNVKLDTFSNVFPGQPSLLGKDPRGKSVQLMYGAAYHAAAYTMPSVGTMEMLCSTVASPSGGTDAAIAGNWNGNGICWLQIGGGAAVKIYRDATNANYNFVPADFRPVMHWAITWDGTNEIFYVNGINRLSQAAGNPAVGGYMGFGVYSSVLHQTNGRFQWLTIYNRPLSGNGIAAHAARVIQPA